MCVYKSALTYPRIYDVFAVDRLEMNWGSDSPYNSNVGRGLVMLAAIKEWDEQKIVCCTI